MGTNGNIRNIFTPLAISSDFKIQTKIFISNFYYLTSTYVRYNKVPFRLLRMRDITGDMYVRHPSMQINISNVRYEIVNLH